jgi:membrane-associated phospholipid phosphatase
MAYVKLAAVEPNNTNGDSRMGQFRSRDLGSAAIYLIVTLLIGVLVVLLPLNGIECNIVLNIQNFAKKTTGLQIFQVLTYLGNFYVWVLFASVYVLYAYFKSRKLLESAIELSVFFVITTALTSILEIVFVRPRPNCPRLIVSIEDVSPSFSVASSFSYPSGHVSRATGGFLILSRESRTKESLAATAIFIVSLSRIVLGAHYLTDVIGGIFLSLAAQKIADLSMLFFNSKFKLSSQSLSSRIQKP